MFLNACDISGLAGSDSHPNLHTFHIFTSEYIILIHTIYNVNYSN